MFFVVTRKLCKNHDNVTIPSDTADQFKADEWSGKRLLCKTRTRKARCRRYPCSSISILTSIVLVRRREVDAVEPNEELCGIMETSRQQNPTVIWVRLGE